ncbi:MAG TPA: DinB family protein [Pyrinomonadaceae bacterium]|jgi:hypothetical protein
MTYHSVAEIFAAIDRTRERIYGRVETLNDEQAGARSSPDGWSVAEIVEHLAMIEERLSKMMGVMLFKAESAGSGKQDGPAAMKPFSLDEYEARSLDQKFEAPEAVRPRGGVALADLLKRLRGSREELRHLQPRMEAADFSAVTYPHPAFGPLNLYQWLAFIGVHEERHLRQIETLLAPEN